MSDDAPPPETPSGIDADMGGFTTLHAALFGALMALTAFPLLADESVASHRPAADERAQVVAPTETLTASLSPDARAEPRDILAYPNASRLVDDEGTVRVAQKALRESVKTTLDDALQDPALEGARVSLLVAALGGPNESPRVLFERNGQTPGPLLGTEELLVASAAMGVLNPEYRFRTYYSVRGRLRDGVLRGDIVIRGSGDPSVDEVRLDRVANSIALGGLERVLGGIVIDPRWAQTLRTPDAPDDAGDDEGEDENAALQEGEDDGDAEDLESDEPEATEQGELQDVPGLSWAEGRISLRLTPQTNGKSVGLQVWPASDFLNVSNLLRISRFPRHVRTVSWPSENGLVVVVDGAMREDDPSLTRVVDVPPSARLFGLAFERALKQHGVKIRRRLRLAEASDHRLRRVATDHSDYLIDLVEARLQGRGLSDTGQPGADGYHDAFLRTVAAENGHPATLAAGHEAVRAFFVDDVGLPANAWSTDGSLSAENLLRVLAHMDGAFEYSAEFLRALGGARANPVLKLRVPDSRVRRRARIVADSAPGQSALWGLVAGPQGARYAVVMLTDGHQAMTDDVWRVEARVLSALVGSPGASANRR